MLEEVKDKVAAKSGVVRIGSLCSGLGTEILSATAISEAWTSSLSSKLEFRHEFVCEITKKKRDLLLKTHEDVQCVFDDVLALGRKKAYCYRAEEKIDVPSGLDILAAGFSCKSFSLLNGARGQASVLNARQSTGKTLEGVRRYVKEHRPCTIILENVAGIMQQHDVGKSRTAADEVVLMFKKLNYIGVYLPIDSRMFLLPQSRQRVWFFFKERPTDGDEAMPPRAMETMAIFKRGAHFKLEDVVGDTASTYEAKDRAGEKYIQKHDNYASVTGSGAPIAHIPEVHQNQITST
jgi:site-specific DNA-cytosine methylase